MHRLRSRQRKHWRCGAWINPDCQKRCSGRVISRRFSHGRYQKTPSKARGTLAKRESRPGRDDGRDTLSCDRMHETPVAHRTRVPPPQCGRTAQRAELRRLPFHSPAMQLCYTPRRLDARGEHDRCQQWAHLSLPRSARRSAGRSCDRLERWSAMRSSIRCRATSAPSRAALPRLTSCRPSTDQTR